MRNPPDIQTRIAMTGLSAVAEAIRQVRETGTRDGSRHSLGDALRQADARIEGRGRLVRSPVSRQA
ncbi:hypothetical protein [Methylobacterium sp. Leaf112]|uniref:hypothetical protein n=1 Tax=Methylobacterium sp. Leaf112 TaxID=1736258 RepID=UPI0006FEDEE6|nr:hypothetical protein [Methylobacterium sp. Leaf112]KQP62155.1 hypothetical protein ASF52_05715 [Methylobacterium sp. Leaf112]